MGRLQLGLNKTLKLVNVLKWKVDMTNSENQMEIEIQKMKDYISVNGGKQIGPLIRYIKARMGNGDIDLEVVFMLQSDRFINHKGAKYMMEPMMKITNCMYCRYIGPEEKIHYAYDKIQLEAFENDIPLKGDSYTIFVDRDAETETITADVFMERAD